MRLASLLREEFIEITRSLSGKNEAIVLLADKIQRHYSRKIAPGAIDRAVAEREALGKTPFENGVAIPHARLDDFDDLIVGITVFKNDVEESGDRLKILFLVLTSKTSSQLYLNTLSAIANITENAKLLNELHATESAAEFIELLDKSDISVGKELQAKDIMAKDPVVARPDMSVKDLLNLFAKYHHNYLPVVDEQHVLLGEVTSAEIVKAGIPEYAEMVGNMAFLSSFEPFEDLLKNENELNVDAVMRKPVVTLRPTASIVELAFELTQNHERNAAIVSESGVLLGVTGISDIINKILRV